MKDVEDGQHRPEAGRGGYVEYSRTASGGIIYSNPTAPPEARWLIEHEHFGNKFFADHDKILPWCVEEARRRYIALHGETWKK